MKTNVLFVLAACGLILPAFGPAAADDGPPSATMSSAMTTIPSERSLFLAA